MADNIKAKSCMNPNCDLHGKSNEGNIRTHGWYKTKIPSPWMYLKLHSGTHEFINVLIAALTCSGSDDQTVQICLIKSKSAALIWQKYGRLLWGCLHNMLSAKEVNPNCVDDSGSFSRGSNPWGATRNYKGLTLLGLSLFSLLSKDASPLNLRINCGIKST